MIQANLLANQRRNLGTDETNFVRRPLRRLVEVYNHFQARGILRLASAISMGVGRSLSPLLGGDALDERMQLPHGGEAGTLLNPLPDERRNDLGRGRLHHRSLLRLRHSLRGNRRRLLRLRRSWLRLRRSLRRLRRRLLRLRRRLRNALIRNRS